LIGVEVWDWDWDRRRRFSEAGPFAQVILNVSGGTVSIVLSPSLSFRVLRRIALARIALFRSHSHRCAIAPICQGNIEYLNLLMINQYVVQNIGESAREDKFVEFCDLQVIEYILHPIELDQHDKVKHLSR
jgi:hypothetical protein